MEPLAFNCFLRTQINGTSSIIIKVFHFVPTDYIILRYIQQMQILQILIFDRFKH